jgi:hypothetical protein
MPHANESWESVFEGLGQLRDNWPAPETWSYDRRLKCVASSISMISAPAAETAIVLAMPLFWSAESLASAPASARGTAEACGGLRASQRIFWGPGGAGEGAGAFGLWWPWADGVTVSLRIGLHDLDVPKERYPRLRDVFGIPQAATAVG